MIPAGRITEDTFKAVARSTADEGDIIVDGGNSNFRDSKRRYVEAKHKGIHFIDAGVSGGIWGLEDRLLPDGRRRRRDRYSGLEPIFEALAPEDGYAHVGPSGAGHFVKMVTNGIEYGLMQSYAEGFEIMSHSEYEHRCASGLGHLAKRIGRAFLAARAVARGIRVSRLEARGTSRLRRGLGRRDAGRSTRRSTRSVPAPVIAARSVLRTLRVTRRHQFSAKVARTPQPVRRPCGQGRRSAKARPGPAVMRATLRRMADRAQSRCRTWWYERVRGCSTGPPGSLT